MNRREVLLTAAALAACSQDARGQAERPTPPAFPMRRGVNLGNALEAPNEGDWGYRIEAAHLDAIADAGFDGVRLPVRWDQHMDARGRVAPAHMARVGEVIGWAIERGLHVQLDAHHYASLIENPRRETRRFLALWRQISEHFADASYALLFEPLNEPHGAQWDGERLTDLQASALEVIRVSNPSRLVVLGPGNWQNIDALERWRPPPSDNVAVSIHYYEPHAFTHQNAEWLGADAPTFDRVWGGFDDRSQIHTHLHLAQRWGLTHRYAMQLGEFGVVRNAPAVQRDIWLGFTRRRCEQFGLGWCVWDFAGAFAIWDREAQQFYPGALEPLLD